jgi:hypothetical protein
MPFLRFKGFEKDFLQGISVAVATEFSRIANIPKDIVKIERLIVEQVTDTPLSVEIFMFPREQKIHDALAAMLHHILDSRGYKNVHIFYILLSPALYYKGGCALKEIPALK